jgi:hypothetical protein
VAHNPAGLDGDAVARFGLDLGAAALSHAGIGPITGIESVALTASGDAYLTYDRAGMTGGVMFVSALSGLADAATLGEGTRRIEGAATGLVSPKGIHIASAIGVVLVADVGAKDIKAFSLEASGNVAPSFVVDLGGVAAWDMDYDAAGDRLYAAATNGDVLVYDAFSVDDGASGPTRVFTPTDGLAKVTVNLHGIQYVPSFDTLTVPDQLVLTDVGDAMSAADGQILTIADPQTADGDTPARLRVVGPLSALGNPVDLAVDSSLLGDDVYVAEKANDKLMRFDAITTQVGVVDVAADEQIAVTKAESVSLVASGGIGQGRIFVSSNPVGRDGDGIRRIVPAGPAGDFALEASAGNLGDIVSVQSAAFDALGHAYLTYDRPGGLGGLMVVESLVDAAASVAIAGGTRRVQGQQAGLVAPKGLAVAQALGVVLVADVGAKNIKAFAFGAIGDQAPAFTVSALGDAARAAWDVAYDAGSDRLFAACTDGTALVYEQFSVLMGADGPTRTIVPSEAGGAVSVNLHGIAYIPSDDMLVLSDVGVATDASDGQIFTLAALGNADGNVDVRWRARGPATALGNPVDISVGGAHLYVAEKANDKLLRYNGIAARSGTEDVAANLSTEATKPESVFVTVE